MTAQLVPLYDKALKQKDKRKFEIILVDYDTDAKAMQKYMGDSKMKWPGLEFSKKDQSPIATATNVQFLPSLVMMDATGKVLSTDNDEILKKIKTMSGS